MKNLIDIQEKFNNVFDFSKLKESTKKYIERILTESEDEFFFDYSTNKNEIQRNLVTDVYYSKEYKLF